MDSFSFLYLFIDLVTIISFILSLVYRKYVTLILSIVFYFLYPFLYEPFLKFIFKILENYNSEEIHQNIHISSQTKNSIVYHPVYNIRVCGIEE